MTMRELIDAEINKVGEENLGELYEVVKQFAQTRSVERKQGALSKLKRIKIEAPEDFAVNLDLYLSGEKPFASEPDLR